MTEQEIDAFAPKLDAISLAVAINTCRRAGAANAAQALSKHITRLEIENNMARQMTTIDVPRNGSQDILVRWKKRDGTAQELTLRLASFGSGDLLAVGAFGKGWGETLAVCDEKGNTK